jgi:hypothetical protein
MKRGPKPRDPFLRWAEKVLVGDDCWEWTGAQDRKGYGSFYMAGGTAQAHRLAYEFFKGPIPEGLTIDHLCTRRVGGLGPICVRPDI